MPKVLKAKRRKAKPKTKIKPITRPKEKTQKIEKKTKIEVAKMRVSQSLKLPDKVKHDELTPATQQIHAVAVKRNLINLTLRYYRKSVISSKSMEG